MMESLLPPLPQPQQKHHNPQRKNLRYSRTEDKHKQAQHIMYYKLEEEDTGGG